MGLQSAEACYLKLSVSVSVSAQNLHLERQLLIHLVQKRVQEQVSVPVGSARKPPHSVRKLSRTPPVVDWDQIPPSSNQAG
jgi:hypothetical protein